MYKNKRNKQGILPVAAIILLVSFLIFSFNSRSGKNLIIESAIVAVVAPIQSGVTSLSNGVKEIFFKYFYLVGLV